jgi:hypothetical protein
MTPKTHITLKAFRRELVLFSYFNGEEWTDLNLMYKSPDRMRGWTLWFASYSTKSNLRHLLYTATGIWIPPSHA